MRNTVSCSCVTSAESGSLSDTTATNVHTFIARAEFKCLIDLGVRDKRRVSEIDLSQSKHETAFGDITMDQWRHS